MSECTIPEFYATSESVARRVHVCCECTAPILAGEKYVKIVGKWEGDFMAHKQHILCAEACEAVRDLSGDCLYFGEMKEESYHDWLGSRKDENTLPIRKMLAQIMRRERKHD